MTAPGETCSTCSYGIAGTAAFFMDTLIKYRRSAACWLTNVRAINGEELASLERSTSCWAGSFGEVSWALTRNGTHRTSDCLPLIQPARLEPSSLSGEKKLSPATLLVERATWCEPPAMIATARPAKSPAELVLVRSTSRVSRHQQGQRRVKEKKPEADPEGRAVTSHVALIAYGRQRRQPGSQLTG